MGLGFYVLGFKIRLRIERRITLLVLFLFTTFYGINVHSYLGPLVGICVVTICYYFKTLERHGLSLYLLGILLLLLELLYLGKLPLFYPQIRRQAMNALFNFGFSFVYLGINFYLAENNLRKVLPLLPAGFLVLLLFGLRTYLIVGVLSFGINAYYLRKIDIKEIFLTALLVVLIVVGLGYLVVSFSSQIFQLNPIELIFYRFAYTFGVLNKIVSLSGFSGIGHGRLWLDVFSSKYIGLLTVGYERSTTTTILGFLIMDGGFFELPIVAFMGATLQTLYQEMKKRKELIPYYAILFSCMLISIEVGTLPLILIGFFMALYRMEI
ncbi:MAG: hypothetical protein ACE5HW_02565 [Candidatus Methanofastidiosia archaeon]